MQKTLLQETEIKERLDRAGVEEVVRGEVKSFGTSAHVIIPKKHLQKTVIIFIIESKQAKQAHYRLCHSARTRTHTCF